MVMATHGYSQVGLPSASALDVVEREELGVGGEGAEPRRSAARCHRLDGRGMGKRDPAVFHMSSISAASRL